MARNGCARTVAGNWNCRSNRRDRISISVSSLGFALGAALEEVYATLPEMN